MIYEKLRDLPDKPLVFYTQHAEICEHHHASIEIAYVITGKVRLESDGKRYELSEHQFSVIGSNLVHSYLEQEGLCMVILLPLAALAPFRNTLLGCTFSPCVFSDTSDAFVKILFDTMAKVLGEENEFSAHNNKAALIQALTEAFFSYLFGFASFSKKTGRSLPEGSAINAYLQQNYTNEITVSRLAKHFGYSEKHLADIIKCLCGMPLKDYLYMLRINQAKRLLLDGLTLDEVAVRVGFTCTRTFLRAFVKITGQTPRGYKDSCRVGAGKFLPPNEDVYFH